MCVQHKVCQGGRERVYACLCRETGRLPCSKLVGASKDGRVKRELNPACKGLEKGR